MSEERKIVCKVHNNIELGELESRCRKMESASKNRKIVEDALKHRAYCSSDFFVDVKIEDDSFQIPKFLAFKFLEMSLEALGERILKEREKMMDAMGIKLEFDGNDSSLER